MGWAETIITSMAVFAAILMTFFILLQEGKGGGLASLGGTKAAGVEGVTNPIRRATGWLAGIMFVLLIVLGMVRKPGASQFQAEAAPAEPEITAPPQPTPGPGDNVIPVAPPPAGNAAPKVDGGAPKAGEVQKTDAAKPDSAKPATPETAKADAEKKDAAKPAAEKTDAANPDAAKPDPTKAEPPKDATPPAKADETNK